MRPDLAATETELLSFITGRGGAAAAGLVVGDDRASADERLHVYAHMYRSRLVEALEATYPRLARHLGHEAFEEIALAYIGDHPSHHPSLRFFGAKLADWLDQRRPTTPWLADLALLEWARNDVFDALDEPVLTLEALQTVSPEEFVNLPLRLIAAHDAVIVDHDTAALWDAAGADEPFDPAREPDNRHGQILLVWRQDTAVYHRVLAVDESAALERVAAGATVGAICEMLGATLPPDQATARACAWLSTWASDGLLAA